MRLAVFIIAGFLQLLHRCEFAVMVGTAGADYNIAGIEYLRYSIVHFETQHQCVMLRGGHVGC